MAILFLVTMILQLVLGFLPANLAASGCYCYMFVISAPNFIGYLLSSIYYVGKQFGFGQLVCLFSGMFY